jgi:hypothetical protein
VTGDHFDLRRDREVYTAVAEQPKLIVAHPLSMHDVDPLV